jgi:ribosomal-protein-alanine N-acetyltransferase
MNDQLTTDRLILRPCTLDDIDALHALWTNPDMRRYLWDDKIIPRETAKEVVEASMESFDARGYGIWLVLNKHDETLAGFAGLRPVEDVEEVELLYGLDPRYWRQGLATEASIAVLRYGFEDCGLEEISGDTDTPNADSIKTIERLGMKFHGERERNGLKNVHYSITRADFAELHG